MINLKGSKTEENLLTAFAGESMARNKYTFYASQAKKEGYEQVADTITNLKDAAAGEHDEWTDMYARFAQVAREEGFNRIAVLFDMVGKIEKHHEERYLQLVQNIEEGQVFEREEEVAWVCQECGHIHFGKKAPKVCPVCSYDQAHFEIRSENY